MEQKIMISDSSVIAAIIAVILALIGYKYIKPTPIGTGAGTGTSNQNGQSTGTGTTTPTQTQTQTPTSNVQQSQETGGLPQNYNPPSSMADSPIVQYASLGMIGYDASVNISGGALGRMGGTWESLKQWVDIAYGSWDAYLKAVHPVEYALLPATIVGNYDKLKAALEMPEYTNEYKQAAWYIVYQLRPALQNYVTRTPTAVQNKVVVELWERAGMPHEALERGLVPTADPGPLPTNSVRIYSPGTPGTYNGNQGWYRDVIQNGQVVGRQFRTAQVEWFDV